MISGKKPAYHGPMALNVVLIEPEIPQNTGNIARTCAATGTVLHLVEPLGFSISQREIRRAGLDYWDKLRLEVHQDRAAFESYLADKPAFLFTTKASISYTEIPYPAESHLIFGCETRGLSQDVLDTHPDSWVRIPMVEAIRCLNLSNSVAIAVYEVLRQSNFSGCILGR